MKRPSHIYMYIFFRLQASVLFEDCSFSVLYLRLCFYSALIHERRCPCMLFFLRLFCVCGKGGGGLRKSVYRLYTPHITHHRCRHKCLCIGNDKIVWTDNFMKVTFQPCLYTYSYAHTNTQWMVHGILLYAVSLFVSCLLMLFTIAVDVFLHRTYSDCK